MKILLVEDNEVVRNLISQLIENLGHYVVMAADKESACDIIQKQCAEIDLILTDCDLPSQNDGLEVIAFTQSVTGFFQLKNVPMILMSGRDRIAEARMAGAEFLPKPFSSEGLMSAIQRAKNELASK